MLLSATARRGVGNATAIWGVVFAVVHVYWAAGGRAGFSDRDAPTIGESTYIAFIALLGLVGAGVAAGSLGDDGVPGLVITGYFLLGGGLHALLGWSGRRTPTPA